MIECGIHGLIRSLISVPGDQSVSAATIRVTLLTNNKRKREATHNIPFLFFHHLCIAP
jgi:hypothetical protein